MEGSQHTALVKISEEKFISKSELLMLLKTYNCYQEGKSFQLRHKEDNVVCWVAFSSPHYPGEGVLEEHILISSPAVCYAENHGFLRLTENPLNMMRAMNLINHPCCGPVLEVQDADFCKEGDDAELIIEGLLNISWGLRRPIRLQMQDDNERIHFSSSKLLRPELDNSSHRRGAMPCILTNTSLSEAENESTSKDDFPPDMVGDSIPEPSSTTCEDEVPQLMRTKSDASCLIQRRIKYHTAGENQRIKRHRFSINGHFYNHKTSVFTPAYGSVTNVRVNSSMNTSQVLTLLLNKFRVENVPDEFALYVVHESGERTKLKDSEYPLIARILHGPCEKIARIFLMEKDLGEEVTYDVAQYIKFEMPVLDSFVEKLKEEEEREINKLTLKYSALRSMIHQQLEDLTESEDDI